MMIMMMCIPDTKLSFNAEKAVTFTALRIAIELDSTEGVICFLQLVIQSEYYLILELIWNLRLLNTAHKYWEELKNDLVEFVM